MPAPLFKVEVAFADGPNAAAPTWTDISSYVRRRPPLTYSRGNNDETSQLQSGSMRFVVDNTDGRFTPGSSASTSAWGTSLKIRRPVRLSIWNGASYVVEWTGTVDDWGAGWRGGKKGESQVTCSDRVASAGRIEMPATLKAEILADSPLAFFPLDDPAGSTYASNASPNNIGRLYPNPPEATGASYEFGYGSYGPEGQTALYFTPSGTSNYRLEGANIGVGVTSGTAYTIEFFMDMTQSLAGNAPTVVNWGDFSGLFIRWTSDAVNRLQSGLWVNLPSASEEETTRTWGRVTHVAATWSLSGGTVTEKLYIDSVEVASAASAGVAETVADALYISSAATGGALFGVALYTSALSADRLAAHAAALNGWSGETTGERWNRLCRLAGFSSSFYTADTTTSRMGPAVMAGQSLASLLQECAALEAGSAYASASGVLTLKARGNRYNKTSTVTFTNQQIQPSTSFETNDAFLVNVAEVARPGGPPQLSQNATSQANYGIYRTGRSVNAESDEEAAAHASWLTYKYAEPGTRVRSVEVNQTTTAYTASTLLGVDVDTLLTLSSLPAPAPSSSIDLFVDGLEGSIGDELILSFNTSPGTFLDGWTLDTDLLGTGTLLLY